MPIEPMADVYDALLAADAEHALRARRRRQPRPELAAHGEGLPHPIRTHPRHRPVPGRRRPLGATRARATSSVATCSTVPRRGNDWRLVYLDVDVPDEPGAADCLGGEVVFHDGQAGRAHDVGRLRVHRRAEPRLRVRRRLGRRARDRTVGTDLGVERRAVVLAEPAWDPENKELIG